MNRFNSYVQHTIPCSPHSQRYDTNHNFKWGTGSSGCCLFIEERREGFENEGWASYLICPPLSHPATCNAPREHKKLEGKPPKLASALPNIGNADLSAPEEGFTQTHNVWGPCCLGNEWTAEMKK